MVPTVTLGLHENTHQGHIAQLGVCSAVPERQSGFNEQLGLVPGPVLNARKGALLLTSGAACLFVPQRLECGLVQVRLLVLCTGSTLPLLVHSLNPWQPLLLIPEDHTPILDTSWGPCCV